jgi:hypothetical protein
LLHSHLDEASGTVANYCGSCQFSSFDLTGLSASEY